MTQIIEAVKAHGPLGFMAVVLGAIGSIIRHLQRVRNGGKHNWAEFWIDSAIGGFCGLLAFLACSGMGLDPMWTAFFAGSFGHMGARGLALLGNRIADKLGA